MIQLSKFLDTENIFISLRSREIPFPTSPVWRIVELQTTVSFGQVYISSSHSVVRFPLSLRIYVHIFREESRRNFCSICLKSRSSQRSPRSIHVHPQIISFTESNMLQEPTKKKIQPRRGDERAQRDLQVFIGHNTKSQRILSAEEQGPAPAFSRVETHQALDVHDRDETETHELFYSWNNDASSVLSETPYDDNVGTLFPSYQTIRIDLPSRGKSLLNGWRDGERGDVLQQFESDGKNTIIFLIFQSTGDVDTAMSSVFDDSCPLHLNYFLC